MKPAAIYVILLMLKYIHILLLSCCALCAREGIEKLGQLDDYRREVNGAYLRALSPIYARGLETTADEKTAFVTAALDLKKLQEYMCPTFGKRLSIDSSRANAESGNRELERLYGIMKKAKIRTSLPITREEIRESQAFLDAFAEAMRLPVVFNN